MKPQTRNEFFQGSNCLTKSQSLVRSLCEPMEQLQDQEEWECAMHILYYSSILQNQRRKLDFKPGWLAPAICGGKNRCCTKNLAPAMGAARGTNGYHG